VIAEILSGIGGFLSSLQVVNTVHSYEQGVKFRFGKDVALLEAGLHWSWPLIESIQVETVTETVVSAASQVCTTSDDIAVIVDITASYYIEDLQKWSTSVEDFDTSLVETMQVELANAVRETDWEVLRGAHAVVCEEITETLQEKVEPWGVVVNRVGIPSMAKTRVLHLVNGG